MRPYIHDNIAPPAATLHAAFIGIVTSIVVAWIIFALDKYFGLASIILAPYIAGKSIGYFIHKVVDKGKIRNVKIVLLISVISGSLAYSGSYYLGYREIIQTLQSNQSSQNTLPYQANNEMVKMYSGLPDFFEYMQNKSINGYTIATDDDLIKINNSAYWAIFFIDLGIIIYAISTITVASARRFFNSDANQWYGPQEKFLAADISQKDKVLQLLREGKYRELSSKLSVIEIEGYPRIELTIQKSGSSPSILLSVLKTDVGYGNSESSVVLKYGLVRQQDLNEMRQIANKGYGRTAPTNSI